MREELATLSERLARTRPAQRLLRRLGLDPEQFVLFLGLFRTLSEHEELMNAVGVNRFNIAYTALVFGALLLVPSLLLTTFVSAPVYTLLHLAATFAFVFMLTVREAPNTLFNPVESSVFAHTPVHGPTYFSAKIAHVVIAALYLVAGLNFCPALFGIMTKGARWYWPITYLSAGVLIGVTTALFICALYGILMRFVSASWLKQASTWFRTLLIVPFIAIPMFSSPFLSQLFAARYRESLLTWLPWTWFMQLGLLGCHRVLWRFEWQGAFSIVVTIAIIWFGFSSFSGSFSESSTIVEGRSSRRRQRKGFFSRVCDAVGRVVTGSPLGLGAFAFVSKMMRRDPSYRRAVLSQGAVFPLLATVGIVIAIASGAGSPAPPSSSDMSPVHIVPQLIGLLAMGLCVNLIFTSFHKASWIYLTAPMGDLRAYARGIYWGLWFPMVALPYLVMLPFIIRLWGWREAALVTFFSVAVLSFYLAFELTIVAGVPFSTHPEEQRSVVKAMHLQIFWIVAVMVPSALQWKLFQIWWVALISGLVLAVSTGFVVRWSFGELKEEMLWKLHAMKMGANQMFKEIE